MSPTGKSFRFVRACERARRGEAVWASERRFDGAARAVVRAVYLLLLSGKTMPARLSTKNVGSLNSLSVRVPHNISRRVLQVHGPNPWLERFRSGFIVKPFFQVAF